MELAKTITHRELKNHPILGKYFNHLFQYAHEDMLDTLVYNISDPNWCIEGSFEALNKLIKLDENKSVDLININEYTSAMHFKQNHRSKVAFVFSGGGLSCVCNYPEGTPVAIRLHELGFSVFTIIYGCCDKAYKLKSYYEVMGLLKSVLSNSDKYNIDPKDYLVFGFSAGAYLAAQIGTNNHGYKELNLPKPGLIALAYPVISMQDFTHIGTRNCLLGNNPTQEEKDCYSSELHVDNSYPNTFLWQCEEDEQVSFKNSLLLRDALLKNNVPIHFESYPSKIHGWGIASDKPAKGWVDRAIEFYYKNL